MKTNLTPEELIAKYNANTANDLERAIIESWHTQDLEKSKSAPSLDRIEKVHQKMRAKLLAHADASLQTTTKLWPRVAAVAAVLIVALGIWFMNHNYVDVAVKPNKYGIAAIHPGVNAATLTLADGSKIIINATVNGKLAEQTGVSIIKGSDGSIIYKAIGDGQQNETNSLSTARGEQVQLRLPDGSTVFLNASSSLKYPVTFTGKQQRLVELSGEGYFEVAKNNKQPFVVMAKEQRLEVLGTHFNVNAYADEQAVKTTLVEGAVKVSALKETVLLKPSQQSVLYQDKLSVSEKDVESETAWRYGLFMFDDEPLESIMRKISRWYDVEIVFQDVDRTKRFGGSVSRFDQVSQVLRQLELTGGVHFKLDERRIIVMK